MGAPGLGQLAYSKGMQILAASQGDALANEDAKLQHGLLTYALLVEGLAETKADRQPKDGRVSLREWLRYPEQRVPGLDREARMGTVKVNQRFSGRGFGFKVGKAPIKHPKLVIQEPQLFDFRKTISDFSFGVSQ